MTAHAFDIRDTPLAARPSGALWLSGARLLAVADLHLGRAERMARRGGALAPPYEARETLARLAAEIEALSPGVVICLGDSFDDGAAAAGLDPDDEAELRRLMAGRRWIWISGNHDPGPLGLGGEHRAEHREGRLVFRHIATPGAEGELSGHHHPKARLGGRRRPAFLVDEARAILPAFGVYTGGLDVCDAAFDPLFGPRALALATGRRVLAAPRAALRRAAA